MDSGKISTRYAKAIYAFAQKQGEETRLYEEMKILTDSFSSFRTLNKVLADPTVSGADKLKVLTTAAGMNVSKSYGSLLRILLENKRESYALSVARMYQEYYRKQKNMVIANLISPVPASDDFKKQLKEVVGQVSQSRVDFVTHTDASVIGGFVLKLNDYQLDASVKTQLQRLKKELIELKN